MAIRIDEADTLVADPRWLPHRVDGRLTRLEFVFLDRDGHRGVTFLEDKHLPPDVPRRVADVGAVAAALRGREAAPLHLILHSTFCLSTLAARVFDRPGVSMGLKEPMILSWLASWRRRSAAIGPALDVVLALLARPFAPGEAIVVKPSNIVNLLADDILTRLPDARAVLLYSPLPAFLPSVAKKGMWGRIEARRLFTLLRGDGLTEAGFSADELFLHTDLQIAAGAWLGHHRDFARLLAGPAAPRLATLDSVRFAADRAGAVGAMATHFGLSLDVAEITAAGVLDEHAKELGRVYDSDMRSAEAAATRIIHGDEVDMVVQWAGQVATHIGVPLDLPRALAWR